MGMGEKPVKTKDIKENDTAVGKPIQAIKTRPHVNEASQNLRRLFVRNVSANDCRSHHCRNRIHHHRRRRCRNHIHYRNRLLWQTWDC